MESEPIDVEQRRNAETKEGVRGDGLDDGSKEEEAGKTMLPSRPITALAVRVAGTQG